MFSHVTVGSNDLERAGAFYDALLAPLGLVRRQVEDEGGPKSLCWMAPGRTLPRFYVYSPFDRAPATPGNGAMVAFLAASPEAVKTAWAAGLAHRGKSEGAPGGRPRYGLEYYGAYL